MQYESYLRVICADFGKVDVSRILRQDLEDWLEESEWSPRTRKNYLVTLTTILNFAVGKGYRMDNPAASIARPILAKEAPETGDKVATDRRATLESQTC